MSTQTSDPIGDVQEQCQCTGIRAWPSIDCPLHDPTKGKP